MATANFGNTVKVHYTVKLEDGTVVDSTTDHDPFVLTLGMGQAIPGFEKAVIGMSVGSSKSVAVGVEEAYGPYHKELITEIDRGQFPEDLSFSAGDHLQMPLPEGQTEILTVLEIREKTIVFDRNHPLAGKNLTIDIQLLEVL